MLTANLECIRLISKQNIILARQIARPQRRVLVPQTRSNTEKTSSNKFFVLLAPNTCFDSALSSSAIGRGYYGYRRSQKVKQLRSLLPSTSPILQSDRHRSGAPRLSL